MSTFSKAAEFFLVSLPGLEDLVAAEFAEWFPDLPFKTEHGGVTVTAPLSLALSFNQVLRTPTRILLRVDTFRCRDFPKLYKKISEFPWSNTVDPTCDLSVQATSRLSRLKMKKRIEETVVKAWRAYQKAKNVSADKGKPIELFVRIHDDECTLSLDTSGERLHKRGEKEKVGAAPLRETIAAGLIQWVGREFSLGSQPVEIVDPMMGSGTFLVEALRRDSTVESRDFSAQFLSTVSSPSPSLKHLRPRIKQVRGYEVDNKAFATAKANLKLYETIELFSRDIFVSEIWERTEGVQRWLFCNPPYGERLKVRLPLERYYAELFAACCKVANPDRATFLLPAKAVKGRLVLPSSWRVLAKRPFLNGGIPVVAFVLGQV